MDLDVREWKRIIVKSIGITTIAVPCIVFVVWFLASYYYIEFDIPNRAIAGAKEFEKAHPDTIPVIAPGHYRDFYPWTKKLWPVVLKNVTDDWPARNAWTPTYISEVCEDDLINVHWGNIEQSRAFVEPMTWEYFLKLVDIFDNKPLKNWTLGAPYFAESYDLLERHPELFADVGELEWFPEALYPDIETCLWVGPKGASAGLHNDPEEINVLFQMYGTKHFYLSSPLHSEGMYANGKYDDGAVIGGLDPLHWNEANHPKFKNTKWYKVTLEAGDALYVPPRWWHYTQVVSTSISLSVRPITTNMNLLYFHLRVLDKLHEWGLWGITQGCTCHSPVRNVSRRLFKQQNQNKGVEILGSGTIMAAGGIVEKS